jgi:PadR family transcriptional regulator, regulatory protein AphA
VSTSPKFAILGFLYIRPMHGYDLHKHLQADLCEVWRISQSQAYNILRMLEKDGWITATLQPQEKRPDRALLSLTPPGQAAFEQWLYAPSPGNAQAIRIAFISRLYFASQIDANLCSRLIQEQVRSVQSDLDALFQRQSALPANQVYNHLGLELRIRQLATILNWLESCHSCFEEDNT